MTTWEDIAARFGGPAHLATVGDGNEPHVAQVMVGREGDHLWFATREGAGKHRNLRANPRVALMWSANAAETYVWGTAELIDDRPTKQRVVDAALLPYDLETFFGGVDTPGWVLVRVTPTRAAAMVQGETGLARETWNASSP